MKQTPLPNRFFLILHLLALQDQVFCEDDPKYVECVPLKCGELNISYPFYIKDRQKSYCGAPGFDLTCDNNTTTILHIPDNNYLVENIFYNNHSIRVANAEVALTAAGCLPLIRNLSLTEHKFILSHSVSNLFLFSNCSSPPTNLEQHKVEFCGGGAAGNGLAMVEPEEGDRKSAIGACPEEVVAPVELGGGEMGKNWLEAMKRGFALDWIASDCSECSASGGRCGHDTSDLIFRCFCLNRVHRVSCKPDPGRRITLIQKIGIAIAASLATISILLLAFFKGRCGQERFMQFLVKNQTDSCLNVEAFLKNNGSIAPKRFTYSDIKKMTSSFKTKLGKGGHGYVYKGQLKDNTLVAVKILNPSKGTGEEFVNEIASISRTSHVNVVTLLGYCCEGRKRSLVYEFMQNGSMEKYIYDENSLKLGWETLYQIALGIARGLEYLHRGCNTPILHFDIKPHNILLDANFHPKIADFGLSKLCLKKESKVSLVGTRGTPGFIAPEVFSRSFGVVSHKSDVYSYGMLVLEMIGKRRKNVDESIDQTSEMYFPDWIYKWLESDMEFNGLVDNKEGKEIVRKMIIVSLWCIQINPNGRPSMSRVVEMMVGSLDLLQVPPKPYFSCEPPTKEDADASSPLQSQTM